MLPLLSSQTSQGLVLARRGRWVLGCWQARWGSNPQPPVLETGARPVVLHAFDVELWCGLGCVRAVPARAPQVRERPLGAVRPEWPRCVRVLTRMVRVGQVLRGEGRALAAAMNGLDDQGPG